MRSTAANISMSDNDWEFILDSLHDRLENLADLNTFNRGEFDKDILQCELIISTIQNRIAD